MRKIAFILSSLAVLLGLAVTALSQQSPEEEKSYFLSFVEEKLSSDNRRISITDISGVLSSDSTIGKITVADRRGVWLTISDVKLKWSRTALLRGRLDIESLTAANIAMTRMPDPERNIPSPEATGFSVPELPLSVEIDEIGIAQADFDEAVFGAAASLGLKGSLALVDGSLDTKLEIGRLDGAHGNLSMKASFSNRTRRLSIDMRVEEAPDGVLSNLLKIEGRPAIEFSAAGDAPLSDFSADISLYTSGQPSLAGRVNIAETQEATAFSAELQGELARLIASQYRPFFGNKNQLILAGTRPAIGGLNLEHLEISGGALTLSASARILSDGFLRALALDASLIQAAGERTVWPMEAGEISFDRANLTIDYGGTSEGSWTGLLQADSPRFGELAATGLRVDMGGQASNLDQAASRAVTFTAKGLMDGIETDDPAAGTALGRSLNLALDAHYSAGEPLQLARLLLKGAAMEALASGRISDWIYEGAIAFISSNLAPFSDLAGLQLTGEADLKAEGSVNLLSGGFDITLSGDAIGIETGTSRLDRLFDGVTAISGHLARNEKGFQAGNFKLGNRQVEFRADGFFSSRAADFDVDARLENLAYLDERLAGPVAIKGELSGEEGIIGARLNATVDQGSLLGRRISDAGFGLEGAFRDSGFRGVMDGDLFLEGAATTLDASIDWLNGILQLKGIALRASGAVLSGDLSRNYDGLIRGRLNLDASDISDLAALALREAKGKARASVIFDFEDDRQAAQIDAALKSISLDEPAFKAGSVEIKADIDNFFSVPVMNAEFKARDAQLAGIDMTSLDGSADSQNQVTRFQADASIARGTIVNVRGELHPLDDGGYRLQLDKASAVKSDKRIVLRETAEVTVMGKVIQLPGMRLAVGRGEVRVRGSLDEEVDLELALDRVPLDIIDLVRPDIGARGTIGGVVNVTGKVSRPQAEFLLRGQGITVAQLSRSGIAPLGLSVEGRTIGQRIALNANVNNRQEMRLSASGFLPQTVNGDLDVDIVLKSFPLTILSASAPDAGLGGRLSGTASVSGPAQRPRVSFAIDGNGITAAQLARAGIPALGLTARGNFANDNIRLESASITGPQGLSISAAGALPLSGSGLSARFSGTVPLALANRSTGNRGTRIDGLLDLQGSASGSLDAPRIVADLSTSNATLTDPLSRVRLQAISLSARLDGQQLRIGSFRGNIATGGSITAAGSLSLADGIPADLVVNLENARYSDGELITATASGGLSVTGQLLRDPLISGTVTILRAELTVPEQLAAGSEVANVDHRNASRAVRDTLRRALPEGHAPTPTSRPSVPRLDVRVNAPARIFVRGRGLDAELGGSVAISGPLTNVQPTGGFEIIRGRLSILGQRIVFDSGMITLVGDLDPMLDFVATTPSDGMTVTIRVTGRISDLSIDFSSQPELPQDEVLARLIFGKGISELSPLQIARLAAAASELAGSGPSVMDGVREATGLDDLEIISDDSGNTAVRAGRYVSENVYLGVEAGSGGTGKVTVDLDITDDLKARGSLGSEESSLGVFFEKDY